jgi:ABC-type glycerol-3-phosphate transport system permease component
MSRDVSTRRTLLLVAMTVPFLYPFYFLLTVALRERNDYIRSPLGLPRNLTLNHVSEAWNGAGLGRAMLNSFYVCTVSAAAVCAVSLLAAHWFMRHRGRAARSLFGILVAAWVIPFVIYLLPLFVMLSRVGLTDNLTVLALVYCATNLPFALFLMDSYLRSAVPAEVIEASRVDGATSLRQLRHVVLPLARPALGTLAALAFIWTWGDLLLAVVLIQSDTKYTLTAAAATLGKSGFASGTSGVQVGAAAAAIAILPLLLVFLVAQRAITRGLTAGFGK